MLLQNRAATVHACLVLVKLVYSLNDSDSTRLVYTHSLSPSVTTSPPFFTIQPSPTLSLLALSPSPNRICYFIFYFSIPPPPLSLCLFHLILPHISLGFHFDSHISSLLALSFSPSLPLFLFSPLSFSLNLYCTLFLSLSLSPTFSPSLSVSLYPASPILLTRDNRIKSNSDGKLPEIACYAIPTTMMIAGIQVR